MQAKIASGEIYTGKDHFPNDPVYILDPDDFKYVAPGQTGVFQTGFTRDDYAGTIEVVPYNSDVLSVDENGAWVAKQEGWSGLDVKVKLSDEIIAEILARYPVTEEGFDFPLVYPFMRTELGGGPSFTVTNRNSIFRLYNPNSGEHFYTEDRAERRALMGAGWTYEKIGWLNAEDRSRPIYRLYNPNAGDHHYTWSELEADGLVSLGWVNEGVAMYAEGDTGTPIYRLYNPNATTGAHHFTSNIHEYYELAIAGWSREGIAFYANSEKKTF